MDKDTNLTKSRTNFKDTSLGDFSCYISCKASMIKCIHYQHLKPKNIFHDILNKTRFS